MVLKPILHLLSNSLDCILLKSVNPWGEMYSGLEVTLLDTFKTMSSFHHAGCWHQSRATTVRLLLWPTHGIKDFFFWYFLFCKVSLFLFFHWMDKNLFRGKNSWKMTVIALGRTCKQSSKSIEITKDICQNSKTDPGLGGCRWVLFPELESS